MRILFIVLATGLIMSSCTDLKPVEMEAYYDVDSLIDSQYNALKLSGLKVFKKTTVNGITDTSYILPDTSQWEYELGVFRKAAINKPALRGVYQTETTASDREESGEYTRMFIPDKPENYPVKKLEVRFTDDVISELHAELEETNPVYGSTRSLHMYFEGKSRDNRLLRYEVNGTQKMVLKDTVTLNVLSEILYERK